MTDAIKNLEARLLHQAALDPSLADRFMVELSAIRTAQAEIKTELTAIAWRFKSIEEWQRRHDQQEAERKTDLRALIMPALGQLVWLAVVAGIGFLAGSIKH